VAVNGVCLTVSELLQPDIAAFDLSGETLSVTNLGLLHDGDPVNLERPLQATEENGGHAVSGHVIGTLPIEVLDDRDDNLRVWLQCPPRWLKFIFHKGFVALDGVSLTVSTVELQQGRFAVNIIPETRARTTFGYKCAGDLVNLEIDSQIQAVVETVERFLESREGRQRLGFEH